MTFYLRPHPYRRVARRWAGGNERTLGVYLRVNGSWLRKAIVRVWMLNSVILQAREFLPACFNFRTSPTVTDEL